MNLVDIATLASIVGIPLAVLLWFVPPHRIVMRMRRRSVNIESILALQRFGLIVEDQALLHMPNHLPRRRRIFWPVTPAVVPNLIHAAFVWYLRCLAEDGLKVTVFVFDSYAAALRHSPEANCKKRSSAFIDSLRRMGLNQIDHQVVYQSELQRGTTCRTDLAQLMQTYFSLLDYEDLQRIPKANQHDLEKKSLLRFLKPVFNMVYLQSRSDYGFIMAGCDERAQWLTYRQLAAACGLVDPVKVFIPEMLGVQAGATHALDTTTNISLSDSLLTIREKCVVAFRAQMRNTAVDCALSAVFFPSGGRLEVKQPGKNTVIIDGPSALSAALTTQDSETRAAIVEAVAKALQQVLQGRISVPDHQARRS